MKKTVYPIGLVASIFLIGCGDPSDDAVKNIASKYTNQHIDDIKVIGSHSDGSYTVMTLKINEAICDMPMIKAEGEWMGTGISCSGIFTKATDQVARPNKTTKVEKTPMQERQIEGVMYPLDPFILNTTDGHKLTLELNLEIDESIANQLDAENNEIREIVSKAFTVESSASLNSAATKERLKKSIVDEINNKLKNKKVYSAYFVDYSIN